MQWLDMFGSDICTCRPYLAHGIEVCIEMAQQGGVGLVVYNRKEGRALGEVTKFLVYNARKRRWAATAAETYFARTECVAGVQDMRFQELMPDVFHWLGIRRIDRWASMSNMKHGALTAQGIEVVEQVAIPEALIPADARVEIDARVAAVLHAIHAAGRRRTRPGKGQGVERMNQHPEGGQDARIDGDGSGWHTPVPPGHPASALLCAEAVRSRCAIVTEYVASGESALLRGIQTGYAVADYAAATIRRRYRDLKVPYHSRWRHFESGGLGRGKLDRWQIPGASGRHVRRRPSRNARASASIWSFRACCSMPVPAPTGATATRPAT